MTERHLLMILFEKNLVSKVRKQQKGTKFNAKFVLFDILMGLIRIV